jgi:hypothetical protein
MTDVERLGAALAIARAALRKIADSEARATLPWTHEIAANEYMRLLDQHRYDARTALCATANLSLTEMMLTEVWLHHAEG